MPAKTRRQAGLKQLSSALGLSVTTVSRALAGYPDVSRLTRDRVRAMAAKRGYVPNRAGRALVSGRSGLIGLILPLRDSQLSSKSTFNDAFLGQLVAALGARVQEAGRALIVTTQDRRDVGLLHRAVAAQQPDGVVVADRTFLRDDRVSYLIDQRVPFVVHGRVPGEKRRYAWSDTDGAAAFEEAARRLIALGHRRFGLLTFDEPLTFAHFRRVGLETALRDHGLRLPVDAVARVARSEDGAVARASARLLGLEPRPTAILCVTDALAIKLVEVAAECSIEVPGDVSVIGFDNVPASAYVARGITTFDQRIRDSASDIADLLIGQLDGEGRKAASRAIRPHLVARGSHGPAPMVA